MPKTSAKTDFNLGGSAERLLEDLGQFPLQTAIFGRRARRFGLGMKIPDGPLAYESRYEPVPLSDLERLTLLLWGSGITGYHSGMEYTASGTPDTGCNYPVRLLGRTYQSPAGIHSSELVVTDDSGTYITRFRDLDPQDLLDRDEPTAFPSIARRAASHLVKLRSDRVTLPREMPHIDLHNLWDANVPGSTLYVPVVDLGQLMLDFLIIYLNMGYTPYDPNYKRTCGELAPFIRSGLLDESKPFSLVDFEQYGLAAAAVEIALICQNIILAEQAIGLGGWLYSGINPTSFLGAFASEGIPGLGFRFAENPEWTAPNPVGLDGVFEGLCPPYYPDMHAAVAKFAALKFGEGGTFDPSRPGPFKENSFVKSRVERYKPELLELLAIVTQYLFDTYGKFPASIPTFYVRMYAQAHHLDIEFYDRHYGPGFYLNSHAHHFAKWHAGENLPAPAVTAEPG